MCAVPSPPRSSLAFFSLIVWAKIIAFLFFGALAVMLNARVNDGGERASSLCVCGVIEAVYELVARDKSV